jgi:uncharacterized SAM-binding protein YcdF (DUF218 family)
MFFVLSKILWFIAEPGNLFIIVLTLSGLLLWTPWKRFGRGLMSFLIIAGLFFSVVPIGGWARWYFENRFPVIQELPTRVDGIVIAGGIIDPVTSQTRGQPVIGGAVERITAAVHLAKLFPDAKIIFSGGSGDLFNTEAKEADYVAPFFRQMGISPSRVIFENQARNTVENARITMAIAKPEPDETWVLVTSAFHMPRAMGTFRQAGWSIQAYPTDYSSGPEFHWRFGFNFIGGLGGLRLAVHETLGLIFYHLTGKTDAYFPGPQKS